MATRLKLGKCQVEGCNNKAKYGIFRTLNPVGRPRKGLYNRGYGPSKKEWLYVCPLHEKHIGDENMKRAGGRYKETKGD